MFAFSSLNVCSMRCFRCAFFRLCAGSQFVTLSTSRRGIKDFTFENGSLPNTSRDRHSVQVRPTWWETNQSETVHSRHTGTMGKLKVQSEIIIPLRDIPYPITCGAECWQDVIKDDIIRLVFGKRRCTHGRTVHPTDEMLACCFVKAALRRLKNSAGLKRDDPVMLKSWKDLDLDCK